MQIIPSPCSEIIKDGEYVLPKKLFLKVNNIKNSSFARLSKEIMPSFFNNTVDFSLVETDEGPEGKAFIGSEGEINAEADTAPELNGMSYALDITEHGAAISYENETELIHAFSSFIMSFEMKSPGVFTSLCRHIEDRAALGFRAVHLCVFPETTLDFLKKCVRVCGMLKYTHIVIEFWGMYKYSFTNILSWDNAYTRDDILPIIDDIRGFGAQPVPMLNFLGHASQSRLMSGKHTTLDRYPEYEYLFENDGWTWRVEEKATMDILKRAAYELCELFGEGDYFHFGCDEVYSIMERPDQAEFLEKHLNRIDEIAEDLGRRPLIWGDMLIDFDKATAETGANVHLDGIPGFKTHEALSHISKNHVLCDWQYFINSGKLATAERFVKGGFDTVLCPWTRCDNIRYLCREAARLSCKGMMMTTWHTIMENFGALAICADYMWTPDIKFKQGAYHTVCATLVRKLVPASGYETSGWQAYQLKYNRS